MFCVHPRSCKISKRHSLQSEQERRAIRDLFRDFPFTVLFFSTPKVVSLGFSQTSIASTEAIQLHFFFFPLLVASLLKETVPSPGSPSDSFASTPRAVDRKQVLSWPRRGPSAEQREAPATASAWAAAGAPAAPTFPEAWRSGALGVCVCALARLVRENLKKLLNIAGSDLKPSKSL